MLVFSLLGPPAKLSFKVSHNRSPFGPVVNDNGSGIGALGSALVVLCVRCTSGRGISRWTLPRCSSAKMHSLTRHAVLCAWIGVALRFLTVKARVTKPTTIPLPAKEREDGF